MATIKEMSIQLSELQSKESHKDDKNKTNRSRYSDKNSSVRGAHKNK